MSSGTSSLKIKESSWRGNKGIRSATHEERGVWLEVLFLMNRSPEKGVLRIPLSQLAELIGSTESTLEVLRQKGILAGRSWPPSVGDEQDKSQVPFVYTPVHSKRPGRPVTLIDEAPVDIWFCPELVVEEYKRKRQVASNRYVRERETELSKESGGNSVDNDA